MKANITISVFLVAAMLQFERCWAHAGVDDQCAVTGVVIEKQAGVGVGKVLIGLEAKMSQSRPAIAGVPHADTGFYVFSSSKGEFCFSSIPSGSYVLSANKPGFVLDNANENPVQANIGIVIDSSRHEGAVQARLVLVPEATISGRLLDSDGDPLNQGIVQVLLKNAEEGPIRYIPIRAVQVNELGEFRISNLRHGIYYLYAESRRPKTTVDNLRPNTRLVRTFYPSSLELGSASALSISSGSELKRIDVRLRQSETYHVRGKITGALPNAGSVSSIRSMVAVVREDEPIVNLGGPGWAINADGAFDVDGLLPGPYVLMFLSMSAEAPEQLRRRGETHIQVVDADLNNVALAVKK